MGAYTHNIYAFNIKLFTQKGLKGGWGTTPAPPKRCGQRFKHQFTHKENLTQGKKDINLHKTAKQGK